MVNHDLKRITSWWSIIKLTTSRNWNWLRRYNWDFDDALNSWFDYTYRAYDTWRMIDNFGCKLPPRMTRLRPWYLLDGNVHINHPYRQAIMMLPRAPESIIITIVVLRIWLWQPKRFSRSRNLSRYSKSLLGIKEGFAVLRDDTRRIV